MDFIDKKLLAYCEDHSSAESELLKNLNRETYANVLHPRMLSGHLQGKILSLFSKLICPKNILEIGTYTGYSAICLAEGLAENGKLITIDCNAELELMANKYFEKSGMKNKIQMIIGDAVNIIKTLDVNFDLVFIDADKTSYSRYFDLVIDKMNTGALLIADNVLWNGKILNESDLKKDADTQAINSFNEKIKNDVRVENIILPVRDGLMVARKIN